MKLSEMKYVRPNMDEYRLNYNQILESFDQSNSAAQQIDVIEKANLLHKDFSTMMDLSYIQFSIDTTNESNKMENEFFDEQTPVFSDLRNQLYKRISQSEFKSELLSQFGKQYIEFALATSRTTDDKVLPLLQEENKLKTKYSALKAGAQIEFDGKTLNLQGLIPYRMSTDRSMRKKAAEADWGFYDANKLALDDIYDQLVKVRHKIALELGYNNFVELGYDRMTRIGYDKNDVAKFRQEIVNQVVPLNNKLKERKRKRLGIDQLKHYDDLFDFNSGNPTPKGSPEEILEKGLKMYHELSPETDEFFKFMMDRDLLDVLNKPGKAPIGYCTFIQNYNSPFIFANFNGTSRDIDVLTHEAGHAFQCYSSRHHDIEELSWPTFEACEIHSMSMEFFTYPWMDLLFGEDSNKYFFSHVAGCVSFLPYGTAIDEFQHLIYENPEWTPTQRNQAWSNLEQKYTPYRDNDGLPYLESGRMWQQKGHLFESPFYYIDYCLAQICAFQFWIKANKNRQEAWNDYLRLCQAGGTQSFLDLVKLANLESPFEASTIADTLKGVEEHLEAIDDSQW